jgi:hypothetical protein
MITKEQLVDGFAVNLQLIQLQVEGLEHADSLVQTPYNINSLNWVLGHIAVNRDNVLRLLDQAPLLNEAETDRYKRDSDPIKADSETIISLERLLDILVRGQEALDTAVARLTEAELERQIQVGGHTMTVANRMHGFYFHDTYHTGQTDLLRQVAGVNDKVI